MTVNRAHRPRPSHHPGTHEVEKLLKPAARERKKRGAKNGGKTGGRGRANSLSQNLGEGYPTDDDADKHINRAAEQAAAALNDSS